MRLKYGVIYTSRQQVRVCFIQPVLKNCTKPIRLVARGQRGGKKESLPTWLTFCTTYCATANKPLQNGDFARFFSPQLNSTAARRIFRQIFESPLATFEKSKAFAMVAATHGRRSLLY